MVRKDELWSRIDQLEAEKELLRKEAEANLIRVDVYRDLYEGLLREFTGRVTVEEKPSRGFLSRIAAGE